MRDLAFIAFLVGMFGMGFRRPFLFVVTYAYIDIVSPQRLTYLLLNSVPISLIAFALAVLGWAAMDDKKDLKIAPRQVLILVLLAYCGWTTLRADFPLDALDKWAWVWKALVFAAFLPLTLRTKLRIEALMTFMILSAGSIIIVGGLKTIASHGGGYGELDLMVDNNSGLYEGSTISTVAICIIPIILWLARFGTIFKSDWKVKAFCYALIFACMLIPIGTSTRTGLLCIALLGVLTLRTVKRPVIYIAVVAAAGVMAVPFLPKSYTERMGTIQTYQGDESAATRVAVWKWTMDYARTHPFGGGFEAYRGDQIAYEKVEVTGDGSNAQVKTTLTTDKARAYHSAYFEMLGEQGYVGLGMWLLLQIAGIVRMEVLRQRYKREEGEDAWIAPLATALQSAHIVYLLGACFIAIAFQPFIYMLVGAQIGLDTYCGRKRAAANWRPIRRGAPKPAAA